MLTNSNRDGRIRLGTFGIQGPDTDAQLLDVLPIEKSYGFRAGAVYNLNASGVVRNGEGASGAHSDIARPELAHAYLGSHPGACLRLRGVL
ncbi:MAG TPA: hypothetical protein VFR86_25680 [Burkholderiaceae bacterium]|nr:hypothetical protein [Burkholderiaceae bacterium]